MAAQSYNPTGPVTPLAGPPGGYLQSDASAASFGGQVGTALKGFGQNLEQSGAEGIDAALRRQELLNQIDADNAFNKLQDAYTKVQFGDPNNPNDQGYYGLKGKQAIDAYKPTVDQLDQIRQQISSSLTNPRAKLEFDQYSRRLQSYTLSDVGRHHSQQVDTYAVQTNQASEDLAYQGIGNFFNNDAAYNQYLIQGERAVTRKVMAAGGSNEVLQASLNDFHSKAIETRTLAMAARDPVAAAQWLQANGAGMAPAELERLTNHLKPAVDNAQARSALDRYWPTDGSAPGAVPSGPLKDAASFADLKARVFHQESGNKQFGPDGQPLISPAGAVGKSQILPSTAQQVASSLGVPYDERRLKTDPDYNEALGTEYLQQMLKKYDGNQTLAVAAYNAGPGNVDKWIKANGDPRTGQISPTEWAAKIPVAETRNYVGSILGGQSSAAVFAPRGNPDFDGVVQRIEADPTLSDDARDKAISLATRRYRQWQQATQGQRAELQKSISDGMSALADGHDYAYDPNQIRSLFPPEQAETMLRQLDEAKTQGDAYGAIKGMTPDEMTAKYQQLVQNLQQGGTQDYAKRRGYVAAFATAMNRQVTALKEDPASYMLDNPAVTDAVGKIDQKNPSTFENYAAVTLAAQDHAGVPSAAQHVLTKAQALGATAALMKPGTDVQSQLESMKDQFGNAWDHVFRDLVTVGKLPPQMQSVAALDNRTDAALLARWLQEVPAEKKVEDLLPPKLVTSMRNNIRADSSVTALATSLSRSGASAQQIEGIVSSIEDLAYAKAFYNRDGSAASNAIASFTNKYEWMPNGGARVPADRFGDVSANASTLLNGMDETKVSIPPGFGQLGGPKADDYLHQIRAAPTWITSPKADALWLMDNQGRVVRDKQGKPLSVPFAASSAVPAGVTPPPEPYSAGNPNPDIGLLPAMQ